MGWISRRQPSGSFAERCAAAFLVANRQQWAEYVDSCTKGGKRYLKSMAACSTLGSAIINALGLVQKS